MKSSQLCPSLVGSVAREYRIDLLKKEVWMMVHPADGRAPVEINYQGVRLLGWAADDSHPQSSLELSVVGLEQGEDRQWKVYFNPWYTAELEFECERILVDGSEVLYDGDCFEG
jgi:hypothetical protein